MVVVPRSERRRVVAACVVLGACSGAPGAERRSQDNTAGAPPSSAGSAGSVAGMSASGNGGGSGGGAAGSGGASAGASAGVPSAGTSAAAAGAGAGAGAAGAESCTEAQTALPGGVALHVPIAVVAGTEPFVLGAEHSASSGSYMVGVASFFLSNAVLLDANGARVRAQFTDAAGTPRPYDVLLVSEADPASLALDLLAPPGNYTTLELGIGLPPVCNHRDPTTSVYPLNASSGVYWTWATGYMFIRVEGKFREDTTDAGDTTWSSFAYHIGFDDAFRTVTLKAALAAPSASGSPRLVLDMSELMTGGASAGGLHVVPDLELADRFAAAQTLKLLP